MIGFEVWHNGKKIMVAGVGDVGFLLAVVGWNRQEDGGPDDATLDLCGQSFPDDLHRVWRSISLQRGDEVLIRLVDVGEEDVTPPTARFLASELEKQ